jgi:serine/threonine protein kinase
MSSKIRNYTILSKLGKGAFGVAYKVIDESKFKFIK